MLCSDYAGSFTEFATEADSSDKSQPFEVNTEGGSDSITEHPHENVPL